MGEHLQVYMTACCMFLSCENGFTSNYTKIFLLLYPPKESKYLTYTIKCKYKCCSFFSTTGHILEVL